MAQATLILSIVIYLTGEDYIISNDKMIYQNPLFFEPWFADQIQANVLKMITINLKAKDLTCLNHGGLKEWFLGLISFVSVVWSCQIKSLPCC